MRPRLPLSAGLFRSMNRLGRKNRLQRCVTVRMFRILSGMLPLLMAWSAVAQIERGVSDRTDLNHGVIGTWIGPFELRKLVALSDRGWSSDFLTGDFALTAEWTFPEGESSGGNTKLLSAADHDGSPRWELFITETGAARFDLPGADAAGARTLNGPSMDRGRSHHIAVNVKRDPRQPLSGLWVDGVEVASTTVPPAGAALRAGRLTLGGGPSRGTIGQIRLYNRALSRPEILELAMMGRPKPAVAPFDGAFSLMRNEVIAVLGGSEAVALMEDGGWETHLITRAPDASRPFSVRSLAWETDTVLRQDRPLSFGSLHQQLDRVGATTVALMFGRLECLERGPAGIAEFERALDAMLRTCRARTPRLAVFGPAPFEKKAAPLPDLSPLNATLARYSSALSNAAKRQGALFVDVLGTWPAEATGWTTDGLTLNAAGVALLADVCARPLLDARSAPPDGLTIRLRDTVRAKHRLWHEYWRPSNWAFLHGDRTAQPSSRDHLNPSVRWFPAELEHYRSLIAAKESEIWKQANELGGKLP